MWGKKESLYFFFSLSHSPSLLFSFSRRRPRPASSFSAATPANEQPRCHVLREQEECRPRHNAAPSSSDGPSSSAGGAKLSLAFFFKYLFHLSPLLPPFHSPRGWISGRGALPLIQLESPSTSSGSFPSFSSPTNLQEHVA